MRTLMLVVLVVMALVRPVFATEFESDVTILDNKEIIKLSDDKIQDSYLNTVVELDASKTFHNTSGFTPKDYKEYKSLVKFRLLLLIEMHRRNIEIPQFDRYSI